MPNVNLSSAKNAQYDEFYTQFSNIEKEMNAYLEFDGRVSRGKTVLLPCDDPEWNNFTKYFAQNFEKLGLKKLVSTSYAPTAAAHAMQDDPLRDRCRPAARRAYATFKLSVAAGTPSAWRSPNTMMPCGMAACRLTSPKTVAGKSHALR